MGKMSLSIYMKGYYEEFHALRRRKNKANQSQFILAPSTAVGLKNQGPNVMALSGGRGRSFVLLGGICSGWGRRESLLTVLHRH